MKKLFKVFILLSSWHIQAQPDSLEYKFVIPSSIKPHDFDAYQYYRNIRPENTSYYFTVVDSLIRVKEIRGSFKRLLIDSTFITLKSVPVELRQLILDSFDFYVTRIGPYTDMYQAQTHFPLLKALVNNKSINNEVLLPILLSPKLKDCQYFNFPEDRDGLSEHQLKSLLAQLFKNNSQSLSSLRSLSCNKCYNKNLDTIISYIKYLN